MDDGALPLDAETKAIERPSDHKNELRLWLRLFSCKVLIEGEIRRRLRDNFDMTLPRFDLMAQLERHPGGLRMGELSRRLMVTGGNITGLTDQLASEGLVERVEIPQDRRANAVRLTPKGNAEFAAMARAHEAWVIEMFGDLPAADRDRLYAQLGRLKTALRNQEDEAT